MSEQEIRVVMPPTEAEQVKARVEAFEQQVDAIYRTPADSGISQKAWRNYVIDRLLESGAAIGTEVRSPNSGELLLMRAQTQETAPGRRPNYMPAGGSRGGFGFLMSRNGF